MFRCKSFKKLSRKPGSVRPTRADSFFLTILVIIDQPEDNQRETIHPSAARDLHSHTTWPLGRAKARFSEVVRLARSGKPQHVTVHDRDAVVIVASDEFESLTAREVSPTLHRFMSGSPLSGIEEEMLRPKRFHRGGE